MLKIKVETNGLEKLEKHIDYVNKMLKMKTDVNFQKYIQDKCLATLNKVMNERLSNKTTDNGYISLYKKNNFIEETKDGFILYNHTVIPIELEGYGGEFSIALAFEYGIGLVGAENPKENAWAYNVKGHEKGWIYFKNGRFYRTRGYQGMEIYRYTAIEIEKNLNRWLNEYFREKV